MSQMNLLKKQPVSLYWLASIMSLYLATETVAAEWKLQPKIYSRGGVTLKRDLSKESSNHKTFNFGPWFEESNQINGNLTEFTLESTYGKQAKHVLGVDISGNTRFFAPDISQPADNTSVNARLNYLEFYDNDQTTWIGQRDYRGDGEYLTGSFPFDEHNMFGIGTKLQNVGPFNLEFALGIKRGAADGETNYTWVDEDNTVHVKGKDKITINASADPYTTRLFIQKTEYPLTNGKLKSNIELHQTSFKSTDGGDDISPGSIIGLQFQNWGTKLFGGDWYNIALINVAEGHIYAGGMSNMFGTGAAGEKQQSSSKILTQWAGDWKKDNKLGLYYVFRYQLMTGDTTQNQNWAAADSIIRPQYSISSKLTLGAEYARRIITEEGAGVPDWGKGSGTTRTAGMLAYHLKDSPFGNPVFRLFAGTINKDTAATFFKDDPSSKSSNYVRLNYEVSVW